MVKTFEEFPGVEWIENEGIFITVEKTKCNGCASCVKVCLAECYKIVNQKAEVVNLEKCMECSACWYVCERGAISFTWPPGGTGFRSEYG